MKGKCPTIQPSTDLAEPDTPNAHACEKYKHARLNMQKDPFGFSQWDSVWEQRDSCQKNISNWSRPLKSGDYNKLHWNGVI